MLTPSSVPDPAGSADAGGFGHSAQRPPLRIALLSYRSKPHCGGQGIYVRRLSAALVALGHDVEVVSGPPYPDLDPGVRLTRLTSLQWFDGGPKRVRDIRSAADLLEAAWTATGVFAEPLTFTLRAWWALRHRVGEFDVMHDNQALGYGLLPLKRAAHRAGVPVLGAVHHPITVDRRGELAAATTWKQRFGVRRWYSFLPMQARVARRLDRVVTVSESSRTDLLRDMRIDANRVAVVPLGAEHEMFTPGRVERSATRILAVASADVVSKGVLPLLEAVAKVRTEVDAELVIVSKAGKAALAAVTRLGLTDAVRFTTGLSDDQLADLMSSAAVFAVPSLYEGFSLPAAEAMASGTPLVVSAAGALPEVVGPDGLAALHVPPGDAEALAAAILRLLGDPALRERLGAAGRARVEAGLSWAATGRATADLYYRVRDEVSVTR